MKVAIQTLGCKVNQYETQAMELLLTQRGHTLVSFDGQADAYLINSCTVTAVSDKKSRQFVRQARRKNPAAVIALCGCYPQVSEQEAEKLPVDLLGGTGDREAFVEKLESVWQQRKKTVCIDDAKERKIFQRLPGGGLRDRTRAMLKVEDGCTNFCTFCIIPYARGPVRSLPIGEAVSEAKRLHEGGYEEITLTGIEISSWGRDLGGEETLADLVEAICRAVPHCRIRLGSLEPRTVTEDFCRRLSKLQNLCPQFHLSLQSGSDAVLKRMKRRYDTARYQQSVALLRQHWQNPGITTDLIVGFPEETDEEFQESLALLEACAFTAMHIFPYSKRAGTPAASMRGQIPNEVKAQRAKKARDLADKLERDYLESYLDSTVEVLFEEAHNGLWQGYTPQYLLVQAEGESLHNQRKLVHITARRGQSLYGALVEERK